MSSSGPWSRLRRSAVSRFAGDRGGAIALSYVLLLSTLIAATGGGIDYMRATLARGDLQAAADSSALAGAKEFRISRTLASTVASVAENYARDALSRNLPDPENVTVQPTVDEVRKAVTVDIAYRQATTFMALFGVDALDLSASATAVVNAGPPICVISLDEEATHSLLLDKNARLEAPGCSIYSDSRKSAGLTAKNNAEVSAAFICSAGGKYAAHANSFSPEPQVDCPVVPDPLADRAEPGEDQCLFRNLVVSSGTRQLTPGTYCGGLSVIGGARVTLDPGIYVFEDGPLLVDGGGTLNGFNVGLFFRGAGAVIDFRAQSTISLTAPSRGPLAGLLVFESRSSPEGQVHAILSNDARTLLGTIYLPQNRLHVAADAPVADESAYTIVVSRLFTLSEGPTMVLNTDYERTNIPVPTGVGPTANKPRLVQ